MFCEECGTKNESGAAFCEKCGHKLQEVKPVKEKKPAKPMKKSTKIIMAVVAVVAVVLIGGYVYIAGTLKPEKIALKYFKAYAAKDADTLYSLTDLEDSKFVSKKILKESLKDEEAIKLTSSSAEKKESSDSKNVASVTVKYVEKGSSDEKTKTVKLAKSGKKWLLFDNWVVDSSELVVKDYRISVPLGTTPKLDGVEVPDKYKSDSYSSYYDSYTIPSMVKGNHKIVAEYKSGLKLAGEFKAYNNYSSYSYTSLKLEDETSEKITKDLKSKIELLYSSAIEEKSFEDIASSFSEDYKDQIEYTYDNLKSNVITDYKRLKEFKIQNLTVSSISLNDDDLELSIKIKYDYKVEYKSGDEVKETSKKDQTSTIRAIYKVDKKDYTLKELKYLITYFSY